MRAIYIKGGSNNIIANNVGVSNSSGAFGYGISLLNTIEADLVPLNCNNNTIQNNTFVGTSVAFEASNTVDTEAIFVITSYSIHYTKLYEDATLNVYHIELALKFLILS